MGGTSKWDSFVDEILVETWRRRYLQYLTAIIPQRLGCELTVMKIRIGRKMQGCYPHTIPRRLVYLHASSSTRW